MNKDVKTRKDPGEIITKPCQLYLLGQAHFLDGIAQFGFQWPFTKKQHMNPREGGENLRERLKQELVTLSANQLSYHTQSQRSRFKAEFTFEPGALGMVDQWCNVYGIPNTTQLARRQTLAEQHLTDAVRNRDYPIMQPILETNGQAAFGIVLATGMDHGNSSQSCRNAAHDVGTDATMQVNNIWPGIPDDPVKPGNEAHIQIPLHFDRMDLSQRQSGLSQRAAGSASEDIVDASCLETLHQQQNLMRTAIQVSPALDMKYFHENFTDREFGETQKRQKRRASHETRPFCMKKTRRRSTQPDASHLLHQRQKYARSDCRPDNTGDIGSHRVHQQEVVRIGFLTHLIGDPRRHGNSRNAGRTNQRIDLVGR